MVRWCLVVLLAAGLAVPAAADGLALRRVMLSTGGVGYFEYEAAVDGPATLGLDVPLEAVDDVLKSLVVYDSAGGVGGIELPGRDASHAAFADVPIGPEAFASPLDYLNALQGVVVQVAGPRPMAGRLVRAERVVEGGEKGTPRTRVTLLGEDGLKQFVLEDAEAVTIADPALRGRIDHALASLAHETASEVRHLTIRTDGAGKRLVRVGYVAAAPLWKATYRLVLPGDGGAKGRLQGWAVLENATGADWNGVSLTLQYGNPVTFRQAIYRTYYVTRPEVPVEVLGRLLPGVDVRERALAAAPAPAGQPAYSMAAPIMAAPPAAPANVAEGAEETLFTLPGAVTLAAGHTSEVPILDREVPFERIDLAMLYAVHPTAAVRVKNDGTTSLPAGVLTLYDRGAAQSYAGDARLGGLPAGEERLLSFAEDLRTTLEWHGEYGLRIGRVTAAGGVLTVERRKRQNWHVTVTAPAQETRTVLLQIPTLAGWRLVVESGAEVEGVVPLATRLRVRLAAGEVRPVAAYVETVEQQQVALLQDAPVFAEVIADQEVPAAARAALQRLADLRAAEAAVAAGRDRLKAELAGIEHEEERLRQNIAVVPVGDALRTRLLHDLGTAEDRIGDLNQRIARADADAASAHAALEAAVGQAQF